MLHQLPGRVGAPKAPQRILQLFHINLWAQELEFMLLATESNYPK